MTHGIFYLILASLCYAVMSIFIRIVNTEIPPFSQMFLRYFVTVTLAFIFVKLQKQTIKSKTSNGLILMILVAFFGYTLSTVFFTFSILATTIATTLFLFSTNVIIAPILAFIILKERMPRNLLIAIGLSLIGALLLFQPDFQSKSVIGPLFALLASFATAVYYVGRRALKNHSAATMMFYATTTGFISMAAA
ncbi:DMT family transporter, partial [Candidatus Gottesmanbacteria bacterium]|nr:DMT family transporter [Candidatus Gottesmanbacteria bacterium]